MGYDLQSENITGRPIEEVLASVESDPDNPAAYSHAMYQALIDNGDNFRFNVQSWPMLLKMAEAYSWKPAGTQPPPTSANPDDWDGNYLNQSGQVVTAADAGRLAAALEAALDDIPDHDTGDKVSQQEAVPGVVMTTPNTELHPFEYFSGSLKQTRLIPFIKFCRKGAFSIW